MCRKEELQSTKRYVVLFIIDFIYGTTGGTENQILKLIFNIDRSKYRPYLACLTNSPWIQENAESLNCHVAVFDYNVFRHGSPGNVKAVFKLSQYIKNLRPDVAMCFFKTSYILGVVSAYLAGVQRIVSTRRDYGELWLGSRGYLYFLKVANLFCDRVLTNSRAVARLVCREEKFPADRIDVIYNGIEIAAEAISLEEKNDVKRDIGIASGKKVIGILAGLRPMKHHETFLKAAKLVAEKRSDVEFVIIGDGSRRSHLEEMAGRLGLSDVVHFLGWRKDIPRVLSLIDVGVNCSANEGLSNAIMEYMVYGVSCVVSRAGGNEELIEHQVNGYTFPLDDYMTLSEYIFDLLEDDQKRREFIGKSRKRIEEEFNLERMIEQYETYFRNLLNPAC
jgi:glycosyltransferase involved in cell wall biosynthesis